ncbi:hypothetical protein V492_00890, partial [Pseudogymnoascus sp. VKM F-4246]
MPPSKGEPSPSRSKTSRTSSISMNQPPPPTTRRSQTADTSSTISDGSNGDAAHGTLLSSFSSTGRHSSNSDSLHSLGELRENHGIDKLLPRRIRSRRRHKKEQREMEELARGRAVAERGTLEDRPADTERELGAGSARPDDVEGDRASLLIFESDDDEESNFVAPPLKSHPSHIGYLTTSSPLVKSSNIPNNAPPAEQSTSATGSPTKSPGRPSRPSTASTPALTTASLQAPQELKQKRSASPVGKLREAFTPRQAPSPSSSPERKSRGSTPKDKESSSNTNRRNSVAARLGSIFPDRQSPQQQQPRSAEVQAQLASPERLKNPKVPYMIDTNGRPSTPPTTIENAAPAIVNTPPTPTETSSPRFSGSPLSNNPNVVTSPSGNMISHRRIRSGSLASGNSIGPSKLSNITSAPLTPTPENGSVTPGNSNQTGFFSSVFSAAQNAANTLTNSINTTLPGQQRTRSNTQETVVTPMDDVEVESIDDNRIRSDSEAKEPAVKTLGMGDLSLSHLGIVESNSASNTPTSAKFNENTLNRGRAATMGPEETSRSGAASPIMTAEKVDLPPMNGEGLHTRPWPAFEPSVAGDHSPQNGSIFDGRAGVGRSNSIRSALRESTRRKRGSSAATTGTTLAAGMATAATPKVTGFAVASKKRNRDFHQLFRSVPEDDYLIEDYSCALQREILAHGRLYVSEGHLCFSSNIFGWVTTLVMSFDEIVSVEKRSTALVFKNGLMISTLHSKNIFASFTSRDSTYDLIVDIWKLGHPSLRSSLNGVRIDETGGGDKTEKDDDGASVSSASASDSDEDGVYDEDEDGDDAFSLSARSGSLAMSEGSPDKPAPRKPSAAVNGSAVEKKDGSPVGGDAPGPATHAPTECSDQDSHYDKVLADEVVPAPLGKIYNLMFGPASAAWMSRWLTVDQKCTELSMEDKRGLGNDTKTRTFSYIKPLNGAIGPRQTKCVITETLDALDLEKAVSVTVSTATPDVPSGNVFTTKTKYCLTWAEGGGTRLQMNCTIEWTGKSWLRGPIEKGANDGQTTYARDILAALRSA